MGAVRMEYRHNRSARWVPGSDPWCLQEMLRRFEVKAVGRENGDIIWHIITKSDRGMHWEVRFHLEDDSDERLLQEIAAQQFQTHEQSRS